MILERVEIVGFRGINRLSLMLEQNNVLIGENAWGKSSLLDALTLLLSPESDRSTAREVLRREKGDEDRH